jgi:hypothetical protein
MINGHYIKAGGIDPTKKIYYDRPQVLSGATEVDYDEPWLFDQNWDPMYYPTDGIYQVVDHSVSADYLKYDNAFGHKFRFTGLLGGYYDFNDSTYKTSAGTSSDFQTEFADPVGGTAPDGYIIDHLTGLGWRSQRGGASTWQSAMSAVPTLTVFTYTDWVNAPASYYTTLVRSNVTQWAFPATRPPFQYDQATHWTCNTNLNNVLTAYRANTGTAFDSATKTTTGANRSFMRLHYRRDEFVLQNNSTHLISYVRDTNANIEVANFRDYDLGWYLANTNEFEYEFVGNKPVLNKDDSTLLFTKNAFGNNYRITNDLGGTVYDGSDGSSVNYAIDHYSGLGWYLLNAVAVNNAWSAASESIRTTSYAGYDNWRMPTIREVQQITTGDTYTVLNPIEGWTAAIFWCLNSTSAANATIFRLTSVYNSIRIQAFQTAANAAIAGLAVRNHF